MKQFDKRKVPSHLVDDTKRTPDEGIEPSAPEDSKNLIFCLRIRNVDHYTNRDMLLVDWELIFFFLYGPEPLRRRRQHWP